MNTVIPGGGCSDPVSLERCDESVDPLLPWTLALGRILTAASAPAPLQQFDPPEIWAQHEQLFQCFSSSYRKHFLPWIVRVQHIIFLPVCIFLGPFTIKLDAMLNEDRSRERLGFAIHAICITALISAFPTWASGFLFYFSASWMVGVLSVQLLLSHIAQPFAVKADMKSSWARHQVTSVVDIQSPSYLEWFHGGLDLHSVHHLYPRMGRQHFRAAHPLILAMCKEHGATLEVLPWTSAIRKAIVHFYRVGRLDPSKEY